MARQAHGAVVARYGDTVVLATACMDNKATEKDFLPLTVDYREYTYSAGKIPGGFFKREGRPSEREILTSRLTDRPLRPLFPEGWATETQIVAMVLSADSENDPDVIAVTAASAALYISKIPFNNPIACVRVGLLDGKLVVNPTVAEQKTSLLNIIVAGSDEAIVMVESGALEVSEETVADALEFGHAEIRKIVAAIRELQAQGEAAESFRDAARLRRSALQGDAAEVRRDGCAMRSTPRSIPKLESYGLVDAIKNEIFAAIPEEDNEKKKLAAPRFRAPARAHLPRRHARRASRRPDARAFDQIRQITCEVGRSAARARLGAFHARRNAVACHRHARHQRRHAAPRSSLRAGYVQALHAALQLPAVFGRRSEIPARPRPPRNRTRRAGRTRSREPAAPGRGFSVRRARASPTFWNRTVLRPWPRFAAVRSR